MTEIEDACRDIYSLQGFWISRFDRYFPAGSILNRSNMEFIGGWSFFNDYVWRVIGDGSMEELMQQRDHLMRSGVDFAIYDGFPYLAKMEALD